VEGEANRGLRGGILDCTRLGLHSGISRLEQAEIVTVHPADHKCVRAEYRGVAGEVGRRFAGLGPVGNSSQSTSPWPMR
jgi:hypothetical protein